MAEQGVASQRYNTELSLSDLTTFKSKELWLTPGCLVEGGGFLLSFFSIANLPIRIEVSILLLAASRQYERHQRQE